MGGAKSFLPWCATVQKLGIWVPTECGTFRGRLHPVDYYPPPLVAPPTGSWLHLDLGCCDPQVVGAGSEGPHTATRTTIYPHTQLVGSPQQCDPGTCILWSNRSNLATTHNMHVSGTCGLAWPDPAPGEDGLPPYLTSREPKLPHYVPKTQPTHLQPRAW